MGSGTDGNMNKGNMGSGTGTGTGAMNPPSEGKK
jgi:hypothetical protein